MLHIRKIFKKFIMVSPLWQNSFDIFVVASQKHFVYDLNFKVMIWLKRAKFSWHCSFKCKLFFEANLARILRFSLVNYHLELRQKREEIRQMLENPSLFKVISSDS